jgi:hypothetical protein
MSALVLSSSPANGNDLGATVVKCRPSTEFVPDYVHQLRGPKPLNGPQEGFQVRRFGRTLVYLPGRQPESLIPNFPRQIVDEDADPARLP